MDQQLPPISKKNNVAEADITPQVMQQVIPDILNPQGLAKLLAMTQDAQMGKTILDMLFKQIAKKVTGRTSARIKNAEIILKKICQKRLTGEQYNLDSINDFVGNRIIVPTDKDIPKVLQEVKQLIGASPMFQLKKIQHIKKDGSYDAWHADIVTTLPGGQTVNSELQVMTPQSEATAAISHDQHYKYGEKIPKKAQERLEPQVDKAQDMSNQEASKTAHALLKKRKTNDDQPLQEQEVKKVVASI